MLGAGRWSGWGFAEFAARPVHPDPGGNRADAEDRARVSEPHSVERDQFEDCALTAGQRRQPLVQVAAARSASMRSSRRVYESGSKTARPPWRLTAVRSRAALRW